MYGDREGVVNMPLGEYDRLISKINSLKNYEVKIVQIERRYKAATEKLKELGIEIIEVNNIDSPLQFNTTEKK